jgi:TolB-like protein
MMRTALRFSGVLLCILWFTSPAISQIDLYEAFVKSPRAAVLPFANLAEVPEVIPEIMEAVRAELQRKSIEIADPDSVATVLRKYRVRNTAELTVRQVETLSDALLVDYLIVGAVDRYQQTETSAEVALSARLLCAASVNNEWSASVAIHSDDRFALLGLGRMRQANELAKRVVTKLFRDLGRRRLSRDTSVRAIRVHGTNQQDTQPCRRVSVLAFANDSPVRFAGHIVTNQLLSALYRSGFEVVDPGRVREIMLRNGALFQGEISKELLSEFHEELGVDFVLTGTVSRYTTVRTPQLVDEPSVALEARLVDTQRGEVVWGQSFAREGKDSAWLFDVGYVHGLATLSQRTAQRVARTIPAVRSRGTP